MVTGEPDRAPRTANLLGAAALACGDRVRGSAAAAAGSSTSGAAAVVTLSAYPGLGVTELGRRVGLSQPAAARMVDGLAAAGLVERRTGSGRGVEVWPTRRGRAAAAKALRARDAALGDLVERLAPDDRAALGRGLEALLSLLFDDVGSEDLLCRLCDRSACLADDQVCPVGQAARTRQGCADC